ncbi:MAG: hypothetical protein ACE5EF_14425, partial [Dehalococcoidia bacterium]
MNSLRRAIGAGTLLLSISALALACSGGSEGTDTNAPTVAAALELLQTKMVAVGPEGGAIAMDRKVLVTFPANAVSEEREIEIKLQSAASEPDSGTDGIALSLSSPLEAFSSGSELEDFAEPIEISVGLPDWYAPEDSARLSAGLMDESTGELTSEPAEIRMTAGRPEMVVRTEHPGTHLLRWETDSAAAAGGGGEGTGFWGLKSIEP